jgi:hypothetical protein
MDNPKTDYQSRGQYVDKNYTICDRSTPGCGGDRLNGIRWKTETYLATATTGKYKTIPNAGNPNKCVGSYELEFSQAGTSQSAAGYGCVKNTVEMGGRPDVPLGPLYNGNLREKYRNFRRV